MASISRPSPSSLISKRRELVALQHAGRFFESIYSVLHAFVALSARSARKQWYGAEVEEPKVIVQHASILRAFKKGAIHIVPVTAAIILAALNMGTYFIGTELLGYNTGYWQDFDRLALQVTAKLYELWIIASLATIIMDILRHELLSSSSGLPLGILAAKTLFVDASYLLSPEFRNGVNGVDDKKKRGFLFLFITICSILALLVGPSSALLLIPHTYSDWQAGGATFYLVGTNESIWPSQLDERSIGGAHCVSPSASDLSLQQLNMSSCIWSGYGSILRWFQYSHLAQNSPTILIQDGVVDRNIILRTYSLGAATFGVTVAPCFYAQNLASLWNIAALDADIAKPRSLSKWANLQYRAQGETSASITSQLPVVLTTCLTKNSVTFADIINETYYPLQPEYPSEYLASLVASGKPSDSTTVLRKQYSFDANMYVNSPKIAAIWLETPADEPIGTKIDGDSITGRSSAYLNVQIPYPNSNMGGFHAACSIDARWVQSYILGSGIGDAGVGTSYQAPDFSAHDPGVFPARKDGNWRTVRLGKDWLSTLTPELAEFNDWNMLSSVLTDIGLDNKTGLINAGTDTGVLIAMVVSTIVTDGMSRSGYENNGGVENTPQSLSPPEYLPGAESWNPIITGTYVLPFGSGDAENTMNGTRMDWYLSVTGLGYRANSVAYYLALAVLFLHIILVMCHIIWVTTSIWVFRVCECGTSTAWSSLTELIALALISEPPKSGLKNASAGVERFRTFEEPIRIRMTDCQVLNGGSTSHQAAAMQGSCEVEMIWGTDYQPTKHKMVLTGQSC